MSGTIGEDILTFLGQLLTNPVAALSEAFGTITTARQSIRTVATGIASAVTQASINKALSEYPNVPLSPAVLADMSIRQLTIPSDAAGIDPKLTAEAALSGIAPGRFAAMSLDTGESYGIDQALGLWHRGSYMPDPVTNTDTSPGAPPYMAGGMLGDTYGITEAELDTVIYYSRVRNEFIPDLKKLSWSSMTGADAVNTLVKGRTTYDLAKAWYEAAGGMPEQFDVLYESAGDSIGVEKAVELHAHKMITDAELHDVITQSRINPRFYDVATKTNAHWLAPYMLGKVVANGSVDAITGTTWLIEAGYPADQAAAFIAGEVKGTVAKPKGETEAIILDDFEAQIITEAEAVAALKNLGYLDSAIPFILQAKTAARVITMRNAAITRTRTAYVLFLITEDAAKADLVALGMPQVAIDQFLTAWTIEQSLNIKRLSMAQVGKLVEDGVIDAKNATDRWVQMGYPPEEAQLLLYIYQPGSKAAAGTVPSVTTVPPDNKTVT